jgi:hypothetical protein
MISAARLSDKAATLDMSGARDAPSLGRRVFLHAQIADKVWSGRAANPLHRGDDWTRDERRRERQL